MKYFWQIILILFFTIVSIAVLPYLKVLGVIPDLIFLIMLSFLYLGEEKIALLWAMLGGILLDLFLPNRFGLMILTFFIFYIINLFLLKRFLHTASFFIFILAILSNSVIINFVFAYFLKPPIALVFITSAYDLIAGLIIYYALSKILSSKAILVFKL